MRRGAAHPQVGGVEMMAWIDDDDDPPTGLDHVVAVLFGATRIVAGAVIVCVAIYATQVDSSARLAVGLVGVLNIIGGGLMGLKGQ
jgi:hypothetical protein